MSKIKLGFLGGGKGSLVGVLHRVAAHMHDQYQLTGGVPNADYNRSLAFAEEVGMDKSRVYKSLEVMIEEELKLPQSDRIQAVSILTPNYLHFDAAKRLIQAGFHIICEKPLTMTYAEAEELEKRVAKSHCVFAVTYTYTGYPMVREMKELIKNGQIGTIQKVDVQYYQGWINPVIHDSEKRKSVWRLNPDKSGISCCIGDIGTHAFDMAEFVTGEKVQQVLADLNHLYDDNPMDVDGTILVRFSDRVKGVIRASQIATGEENDLRVAVYGQWGALKWEQENPNYLTYLPEEGPGQILKPGHLYNSELALGSSKIPPGHPEGIFDAMGNIYQGVAKAINGASYLDGEFPTVSSGLRGMDFIEKTVASHHGGNMWVSLNE